MSLIFLDCSTCMINQYILTGVVHESDNSSTRPQTENSLCNTYGTNIIVFLNQKGNRFPT